MGRSYIESDKWEKNVGEWILFFNLLLLFTLLLLELYDSFFGQEKSLYLFYRDFQNIGLTVGLIFIGLSTNAIKSIPEDPLVLYSGNLTLEFSF